VPSSRLHAIRSWPLSTRFGPARPMAIEAVVIASHPSNSSSTESMSQVRASSRSNSARCMHVGEKFSA